MKGKKLIQLFFFGIVVIYTKRSVYSRRMYKISHDWWDVGATTRNIHYYIAIMPFIRDYHSAIVGNLRKDFIKTL